MAEIWKDIPGYEELYRVSDAGKVYDLKNNRESRPFRVTYDYLTVRLYRDGDCKKHTVHSLVALAFIGTRPFKHHTHHKNGDRQDNRAKNLEYRSATSHYQYHHRGEKNSANKLSEEEVRQIAQLLDAGWKLKETAVRFRVGTTSIWHIKTGKTWAWLTGK